MDRLRLYIPGMAPAPQDAGSVPLKELFCSSRYDSDDMFDQLAGSVPARSLCQELLLSHAMRHLYASERLGCVAHAGIELLPERVLHAVQAALSTLQECLTQPFALLNAQALRLPASSPEILHPISISSTQQQLRRWAAPPVRALSVDWKAPSLDIWDPQVSGRGPDKPL